MRPRPTSRVHPHVLFLFPARDIQVRLERSMLAWCEKNSSISLGEVATSNASPTAAGCGVGGGQGTRAGDGGDEEGLPVC